MEIKLILAMLVPFVFAIIGLGIKTAYEMWLDWWKWNCEMADRKVKGELK